MRVETLEHRFVKSVPDLLEAGILYVSVEYDTTIHLCACGCGNSVVLPLDPTGWRLTYDGRAISMAPSVGNWGFPCRSHYVIKLGRVCWAETWSEDMVASGRERTLRDRGVAHGISDERDAPASPTWRTRLQLMVRRMVGVTRFSRPSKNASKRRSGSK